MKYRVAHYGLAVTLALLLFAFASWGDFSWVTLTGPMTLEPDLGDRDVAGYIASPALQAVMVRLLFLLACIFFSMIPDLARGLRQHARFLLGLVAAVYLLFSCVLGSFTFWASSAPGSTRLRIAVLAVFFVLLVIAYDTSRHKFRSPGLLSKPGFLLPLAAIAIAVCAIVTLFFQSPLWLCDEHIYFVLLRMASFLTALAGALAFYLRQCNN